MKLFTRRRDTARAVIRGSWAPVSKMAELTGGGADMGDDGQAFPLAYAVLFGYEGSRYPGPYIEICCYVVSREPDSLELGFRYRYWLQDWGYAGYEPDIREVTWRGGETEDAAGHARDVMRWAASGELDLTALLPDVFGWDGQPFEGAGES